MYGGIHGDTRRYEESSLCLRRCKEIRGVIKKYEEIRGDRMRYEEMRGDMNRCVGYKKFPMAFKSIQVRGDKKRYRKW